MTNIAAFLIKNDSDGDPEFKFRIGNLGTLKHTLKTPTTALPLPEEDSEKNILVKVEGNSADINLSWIIMDQQSNQEVLAGATTKTLFEQWNFIEDSMQAKSIDDSYRLQIEDTDTTTILKKWDGTVGEFSFTLAGDSPVGLVTNVIFQQGTVVTIYDIDVPSKPVNLDVDVSTADQIDVSWSIPLQNVSDIQGYNISYKKLGGIEIIQSVSAATFTDTLSSLTTGDIYDVKVFATTSTVDGQSTQVETVTVT